MEIKSSDWLTKGISEKQLQKEKEKACKEARKKIARIEKKERRKAIINKWIEYHIKIKFVIDLKIIKGTKRLFFVI
jgi:hypothetical protein